jgi:hypothetical protein
MFNPFRVGENSIHNPRFSTGAIQIQALRAWVLYLIKLMFNPFRVGDDSIYNPRLKTAG